MRLINYLKDYEVYLEVNFVSNNLLSSYIKKNYKREEVDEVVEVIENDLELKKKKDKKIKKNIYKKR